jgi:hypothetical protein
MMIAATFREFSGKSLRFRDPMGLTGSFGSSGRPKVFQKTFGLLPPTIVSEAYYKEASLPRSLSGFS